MTKKEILEGNIKILSFYLGVGVTRVSNGQAFTDNDMVTNIINYNDNWSEMMKVVHNIENLGFLIDIKSFHYHPEYKLVYHSCSISHHMNSDSSKIAITGEPNEKKISVVWRAITKFIDQSKLSKPNNNPYYYKAEVFYK